MRDFSTKRGINVAFTIVSFAMGSGMIILSLTVDGPVLMVLGIALGIFFIGAGVDGLMRRIFVSDGMLCQRAIFGTKRIPIDDIDMITIDRSSTIVEWSGKTIHLGILGTKNYDELVILLLTHGSQNGKTSTAGDSFEIAKYLQRTGLPEFARVEEAIGSPPKILGAALVEKMWLVRLIEISTTTGPLRITYYGRGQGFECILLNDELMVSVDSKWWYVPRFEFRAHGLNFVVNVKVNPWLTIKSFSVEIDGKVVYSEGS